MGKYNNIEEKQDFLYRLESFAVKYKIPLLALCILLLAILPYVGIGNYILRIMIMIGIYIMLGLGLNILVGYTGLVSLGHAGFYGIGAYTAALLMIKFKINFFPAAILGALVSACCGAILCLPTLRLHGPYLSVVTLGFGEIIKMIFLNWESVTNGTLGIRNIPRPSVFGFELTLANYGIYYLMLIFTIETC